MSAPVMGTPLWERYIAGRRALLRGLVSDLDPLRAKMNALFMLTPSERSYTEQRWAYLTEQIRVVEAEIREAGGE